MWVLFTVFEFGLCECKIETTWHPCVDSNRIADLKRTFWCEHNLSFTRGATWYNWVPPGGDRDVVAWFLVSLYAGNAARNWAQLANFVFKSQWRSTTNACGAEAQTFTQFVGLFVRADPPAAFSGAGTPAGCCQTDSGKQQWWQNVWAGVVSPSLLYTSRLSCYGKVFLIKKLTLA